jgi:hypothetical protein
MTLLATAKFRAGAFSGSIAGSVAVGLGSTTGPVSGGGAGGGAGREKSDSPVTVTVGQAPLVLQPPRPIPSTTADTTAPTRRIIGTVCGTGVD